MKNVEFSTQSLNKAVCEQQNLFVQLFVIHPKLRGFKIRRSGKMFIIRAKYLKRALFSMRRTIEEAFLGFVVEFQKKVLGIEFKIN